MSKRLGKGSTTTSKIDKLSKVKKLEALAAGLSGNLLSGGGGGGGLGIGLGFPGISETDIQQQQQHQQQQSQRDNINLLVLLKSIMTELDSSSPVGALQWPSWCYGSENGQDDEKTSSTTNNSSGLNGLNLNEKPSKRRRRDAAAERSSPSDSHGGASDSDIKRSPPPPHHRNYSNYSDFMRSLAAKYNNLPIEPPAPPPATLFSRQQVENNSRFLQKSLIDMSSTTTLLHLVRSATHNQIPLDLTNNNNNNNNNISNNNGTTKKESSCCSSQEVMNILGWSVDEVVQFVSSINLCKEYAEKFRNLEIDGSGLPLLTEEHLITMGMKLGQALKFKSVLQRKLGNCIVCNHHCPCHNSNSSNNSSNNNNNSTNVINN